MHTSPKVSIVIPCYNAARFILPTLQSVMDQQYGNLEIICVNDGSVDDTENQIRKIQDPRIVYIKKENSGVSDSRNLGMKKATGKYILFLDADDILGENFLEKRVDFLELDPDKCFCASEVVKIDETGNALNGKHWKGASHDVLSEVLSYNPEIITCPSNYLFRKETLDRHKVLFDPLLSSSADRFFLIELNQFGNGGLVENAPLFYRVHEKSMSNHFTIGLLKDNILFQKKILAMKNIPGPLKKEFCFKTNYIFAGSYFKLKKFPACFWFSLKAFYYSPSGFFRQLKKTPAICVA
jgi:glycosyltransferase involved in cell wall biosynthesis